MGDLAAKNAKSAKGEGVLTQRRREAESTETAWPMVRLGDVCEFRRGLTYKKSDEVEVSSNVVLRSNNISLESGEFDFSELKYLNESLDRPCDKRVVPGAILMCMANGSKQHLGKVALVDRDLGYAFGGFMGLIIPRGVDSKFVYLMLVSPTFKAHLECLQDGANINNLKFSDIDQFEFPLPPLAIQREIVERLEKELGEAEKVAAGFRRIAENAEAEFKAELDETFKALEEECNSRVEHVERVEGAGDVLATKDTKNTKGGSRSCASVSHTETRRVRLGDVAVIGYGYTAKKSIVEGNGLPRYLRITDIQNDSVDWDKVPFCECNEIEEYLLKRGDIVFARTGATTGKSYLIDGDIPCSVFASYLIRVQVVDQCLLSSCFLRHYFDSSQYWSEIKEGMAGAAQGGFNSKKLANLFVPTPPLSCQHAIVSRLDAARERCDKIKAEAEKGLGAAENLRKAILKEAFEQ